MKWSIALGKIAGIRIELHLTFLLLVLVIAYSGYSSTGQLSSFFTEAAYVVVIFGVVVLHELGHALTARHFGIRTRRILLSPIGGIAELERMPEKPHEELLVALAGPMVNVVLAGVLAIWIVATGQSFEIDEGNLWGQSPAIRLLIINIVLAVFNMIPAFPMDGGRVLRAILGFFLPFAQATAIAASIGKAFAILFGIVGIFGNPILILIAVFIWFGASSEAGMSRLKSALRGVRVQDAMISEFHVLAPEQTLAVPVEHLLAGFQSEFPVVSNDAIVGMLSREDLVRAIAENGRDSLVGGAMNRDFGVAEVNDALEQVFPRLQQGQARGVAVTGINGKLVGLLTLENIGELLMLHDAHQLRVNRAKQTSSGPWGSSPWGS